MADPTAYQDPLMADPADDFQWDAFISHASEDKDGLVRALAHALADLDASVWYDEFSLRPGDSLSRSIDCGLARSRIGLVVLSPSFIGKPWPERELAGLTSLALAGRSRIIPLWHQVDRSAVLDFSPPLADLLAVQTNGLSAAELALKLLALLRPDLYEKQPRDELMRRASGSAFRELQAELEDAEALLEDFQCPYCKSPLANRTPAPVDGAHKHWDEIDVFTCGFEIFGGDIRHPCPSDPNFPSFADYEVSTNQSPRGTWVASANPRTKRARRLTFGPALGSSKAEAIAELKSTYRRWAPPRLHPG